MSKPSIIVVGAGIAGLYASVMLKEEGYQVTLLEASDKPGGRIRSNKNFTSFPIELGAEYIHGKRSLLFEYMSQIEQPIYRFKEKSRYYIDKQIYSHKKAKRIKTFREVLHFFNYQWHYEGEEMSILEYVHRHPVLKEYKEIIEGFAAEYGTTANHLGMLSLAMEERKWDSGSKNYKVEGSLSDCLQPMIDELVNELQFNQVVDYVGYNSNEVVVTTSKGKKFKADKILVTVPLSILRNESILFDPPLPQDKLKAAKEIGMGEGMKIFLRFSTVFWKKKMTELYGAYHVPVYLSGGENLPVQGPVLTAYVMGDKAKALKEHHLPIRDVLLNELDEVYGNKIATKHFEDIMIMDWGSELHVQGCYSFASQNSIGKRAALAKSISNKVFFAGEATNTWGHSSTMHGAMESAYKAVEEIDYLAESRVS